jgi:uncharacterized protein DUF3168
MSRRSALQPVQTAVYQWLVADAALTALAPVYDQVPQPTAFPLIELSSFVEAPDNTEGEQGRMVTVTIFAYDQTPGYKLLEQILDNIMRLLDEDEIPDATPDQGWDIWHSAFTRAEVMRLPDGITRQLSAQFEVGVTRNALGE